MKNENDPHLEIYRQKLIKQNNRKGWSQLDDLKAKCIACPTFLLILGGLIWLFKVILCDTLILSVIIDAFNLDQLMNNIVSFCWIIGSIWLLIGIIVYLYNKNIILKKLEKEAIEFMNYVPDDTSLLMWDVINDNPELFKCNNLNDANEPTNYTEKRKSEQRKSEQKNNSFSYENEMKDYERRSFSYADASGAYRRWGEDFIDCNGNWCQWGSSFYDADGNYINWGDTYKDKSGAYRRWGEDFVDGQGNYIRCPRK